MSNMDLLSDSLSLLDLNQRKLDDTDKDRKVLNPKTQESEELVKSKGENETSSRSKTMEEWLQQDGLIVYPVWIGNLPAQTNVKSLRDFIESKIGKVLISLHVSDNASNSSDRKYAFLNLPFAEKQMLAATLLDGQMFNEEKLIVRPKKSSKFPQSFFGSSPINAYFKKFRDNVAPQIFNNAGLLNIQTVRQLLEENNISIEHLPNRMWCVHCTLAPHCHRSYCSFYHKPQEKELGRILALLAAEHYESKHYSNISHHYDLDNQNHNSRGGMHSHHTLLIQGLPKYITPTKIQKWFEVFGEIDHINVQSNHAYLRMKRPQDASKIVHLLKGNNAKIIISFAPYFQGELQQQNQSLEESNLKSKEDNIIDPSMHKKFFRMNKKRKYYKNEQSMEEWNMNGEELNVGKFNSNVMNSHAKPMLTSLTNLNSIIALSTNSNANMNANVNKNMNLNMNANVNKNMNGNMNGNMNMNMNMNVKPMPISIPFQTFSPITGISSGQSFAFPFQIIPAQVIPMLSGTSPTYIYSEHGTPIQTTNMHQSFMFTHGTPSYCFTPPDNNQYISTPNLIHGLQSPLSPYDAINTPLAAIPMATPHLTGLTTNRNINTNANNSSNYIHNPTLNMQRDVSALRNINEQQTVFPKLPIMAMNDPPLTPIDHLFLTGNTPHE